MPIFSFLIGILDGHLDPIHLLDSFLSGLHVFRGEFRARGNESDDPVIDLVRKSIGGHFCFLPQFHPAKILLPHVSFEPDLINGRDGEHGRAGKHHFSHFIRFGEHHSRDRCGQGGMLDIQFQTLQIPIGLAETRSSRARISCSRGPASNSLKRSDALLYSSRATLNAVSFESNMEPEIAFS